MTEEIRKIVEKINRQIDEERDQREKAIKDLLFVDAEDGQWEKDAKEKRADRPRYTIDRISGPVDQIVGNQRQTKLSIKVFPLKDGTKETADVFNGLIRSIENLSNAENVYDSSFSETVKCGYGGWEVLTDYEDDDVFEQCIYIRPINSAASSLYFGTSDEYSCKDATWAALIKEIPRSEFKDTWPDASETGFDPGVYSWAFQCGWMSRETIRIAEYWEKVPVKRRLGLLTDGRVIDLDEEAAVLDELEMQGIGVEQTRTVDGHKVQRRVINAVEELEPPKPWAGKYIPLVPEFGKISIIEGKKFVRGMVRKAIDPQRIYNYATSAAIEATALTPKDPFIATPAMVARYKRQWETFNTKTVPVLLYDPDPQVPGAVPQRAGAPQLQQALLSQVAQASQDIYATTGMEPSSLGSVPVLKSGKAIQAEQQMGDRGSFVFQNNLEKSLQYTGEILVDLIPRIYDSERIVKIIGEDEEGKDVTINETIIDRETLQPTIVNDLSLGKYGVVVRTGPTTPTKRKETVEQLAALIEGDPQAKLMFGDLLVSNMDINKGEEAVGRIRKLQIKQGLVEPTEEEVKKYKLDQQPPPDPMNEALVENVRIQTEKLIADIENKHADTQKKMYDAQASSVKALKDMIDALGKKLELTGTISTEEKNILDGQGALVAESQIDALEMNELGGSKPLQAKNMPPGGPPARGPAVPTGPEGPRPSPMLPEGFQQ